MTVNELIGKLSLMPPYLEVGTDDNGHGFYVFAGVAQDEERVVLVDGPTPKREWRQVVRLY